MSIDITPEESAKFWHRAYLSMQEKVRSANNRNAILVDHNDKLRAALRSSGLPFDEGGRDAYCAELEARALVDAERKVLKAIETLDPLTLSTLERCGHTELVSAIRELRELMAYLPIQEEKNEQPL